MRNRSACGLAPHDAQLLQRRNKIESQVAGKIDELVLLFIAAFARAVQVEQPAFRGDGNNCGLAGLRDFANVHTSGPGVVVANPNNARSGRMDVCEITEAGETAVISITAESRLLDLTRSRERRYEKQDQLIDFPGDLGFDFVPSLQELSVVWGKATSTSIPHTSSGGGGGNPDDRLFGRRGR